MDNTIRKVISYSSRAALATLSGLFIAIIMGQPLLAQISSGNDRNFDARTELDKAPASAFGPRQQSAIENLRSEMPSLATTVNRVTGATRTVYNLVGVLTAPAADDPAQITQAFVEQNLDLLGLNASDISDPVIKAVPSTVTGSTHTYMQQKYLGLPVYNSVMHVNINKAGSIVMINNDFMSNIDAAVNNNQPKVSAETAVSKAFAHLGGVEGTESEAKLMWLPIRPGDARLVWNFQIETADTLHHYDITVDAETGQVWTRFDWVAEDNFRVYQTPIESPIHTLPPPPADARTLQVNPENPVSQNGWFDAGVTIMDGNNVHACLDTNADNSCDIGEPNCVGGVCDFPIDLTMNPPASEDAAVANLFYWNNYIHDTQYLYGFDEPSGSFQENNFGLGGAGSDSVNADAQDGGGNCNANFGTPPDGSNPRMQMFTCTRGTPTRDGDFDNLVIVHEYGHGISNRLVGGPNNVSCLGNIQQMGEGWSDLLGLIYTHQAGAAGTDSRGVGAYLFDLPAVGGTIRTFPYSTDFAVNPDTYATIGSRGVPHGVGSVWAQIAWEAYWEIVNLRGFDPNLQNVAVNAGNHRMMRYITEGMKNTACSPTFIDARDGIIVAAITNGLEDVCPLWRAFARRGLGTDATTAGPNSRVATDGFAIPPQCEVPDSTIQVPGPVDFGNICLNSSQTETLSVCNTGPGDLSIDPITSSNPQFSVTTPSSGYPLLIGTGDCFPFQVRLTPTSTGAQSSILTIPSNDPGSPTVVAVSGNGTEQNVTVTGSTEFGVVSAWSPGEKTVAICNTGHCDLSVASASVNCPDFSAVNNPLPSVAGSGACLDLVVGFTPTSQGPKSCQLTINSDDPDTPAVDRTLTARTPPFFSIHTGLIEPNGSLGSVADHGSVLNLDFIYPLTPNLAWDVRLGHGSFDGNPGLSDVDFWKLGANLKYTVNPLAPVRFFLNGGLNLYHFDPGDVEGGLNGGLGVTIPIGQRFALEGTYNYHSAVTASPSLEFSQFQIGLLISF